MLFFQNLGFRPQAYHWDQVVQVGTIGSSIAIVLALIAIPLLMLLLSSVKSTEDLLPLEGALLHSKITSTFFSPLRLITLSNTIVFVIGSISLGLVLAIIFAWLFERTNMPFRGALFTLVLSTMVVPPLMNAIARIF
jgi:iron(III) transport system permease protein